MTDRLMRAGVAPQGIAHLEDPRLAIRDVDRGGGAPPLSRAVDFVRGSLLQMFVGIASAIVLAWYAWWATVVLVVAWGADALAAAGELGLEGPQH